MHLLSCLLEAVGLHILSPAAPAVSSSPPPYSVQTFALCPKPLHLWHCTSCPCRQFALMCPPSPQNKHFLGAGVRRSFVCVACRVVVNVAGDDRRVVAGVVLREVAVAICCFATRSWGRLAVSAVFLVVTGACV